METLPLPAEPSSPATAPLADAVHAEPAAPKSAVHAEFSAPEGAARAEPAAPQAETVAKAEESQAAVAPVTMPEVSRLIIVKRWKHCLRVEPGRVSFLALLCIQYLRHCHPARFHCIRQ